MNSNLPSTNNSEKTQDFFDKYYVKQVSFPEEHIDAVNGFFQKKGFDVEASNTISIVLLTQARKDNVNIFDLLNTLQGLDNLKLTSLIAEILNHNRQKISLLGFRNTAKSSALETRNILI